MKFSEKEWGILEVYSSPQRERTIHNLAAAAYCFQGTPQENIYKELVEKIKALDEKEFVILINSVLRQ